MASTNAAPPVNIEIVKNEPTPLSSKAAGIIVQGVLSSRPPTNEQVSVSLDSMRDTIGNQQYSSVYGKRAAKDLQDVILASKKLMEEKNQGDRIQNLIMHIKQAADQAKAQALKDAPAKEAAAKSKAEAKAAKAEAKAAAKAELKAAKAEGRPPVKAPAMPSAPSTPLDPKTARLLNSLKALVLSLANSGEFRGLLVNMVQLAKNTTDLSMKRIKKHNPDQLINPLRDTVKSNMHAKDGPQQELVQGFEALKQAPADQPSKEAAKPLMDAAMGTFGQAKKIGNAFKSAAMQTKDRAIQMGRELRAEFQQSYENDDLPVDNAKLRELQGRFTAMLDNLLRHPELVNSLKALMDILDDRYESLQIQSKGQQFNSYLNSTAVSGAMGSQGNINLTIGDQIWMDVRLIIAQWTGAKELDQFLNDSVQLMFVIANDPQMMELLRDFRAYIDLTVSNPALVQDPKHQEQPMLLFDRAVDTITRFKDHQQIRQVLREAKTILKRIQNDATSVQLRNAVNKLAADTILDESGNINFMVTKDVLAAFQTMAMPLLLDQFGQIPIPPINGTTPQADFRLSNIVVPGFKVLPEHFRVRAYEDMNLDLRSFNHHRNSVFAKIRLDITNFEVDLKNVKFWFKTKIFPRLTDEGNVDVFVGGPDTRIKIMLVAYGDRSRVRFSVKEIGVHLDQLNIKFHHIHHNMLLPMGVGFARGIVKTQVEKAITKQLYEKLNMVCEKLNTIVANAQQNAGQLLTTRLDAQLQQASLSAQNAYKQAKVRSGKAKKQALVYKGQALEFAKGATTPFLTEKGVPLTERGKHAASNVKGLVQPNAAETAEQKAASKAVRKAAREAARLERASAAPTGSVAPSTTTDTIKFDELRLAETPKVTQPALDQSSSSSYSTSSSEEDEAENNAALMNNTNAAMDIAPTAAMASNANNDKAAFATNAGDSSVSAGSPNATAAGGVPVATFVPLVHSNDNAITRHIGAESLAVAGVTPAGAEAKLSNTNNATAGLGQAY